MLTYTLLCPFSCLVKFTRKINLYIDPLNDETKYTLHSLIVDQVITVTSSGECCLLPTVQRKKHYSIEKGNSL